MLKRAEKLAELSTCYRKHGAVIVKGGRVLSVGINSLRDIEPRYKSGVKAPGIHAEVAAIRGVGRDVDLSGATIYVARVNGKGPQMSKPCPDCQIALKNAGIRKVFYTVDNTIDL